MTSLLRAQHLTKSWKLVHLFPKGVAADLNRMSLFRPALNRWILSGSLGHSGPNSAHTCSKFVTYSSTELEPCLSLSSFVHARAIGSTEPYAWNNRSFNQSRVGLKSGFKTLAGSSIAKYMTRALPSR